MTIQRVNFPPILKDNEEVYFKFIEGAINGIDSDATLQITNNITGYLLRLAPSHPQYLERLIAEMKKFHTQLGIIVNFSKSMKSASTVTFIIDIK